MKSTPGQPATFGGTALAGVRLIVWCRECGHQIEPEPAEMAQRHGAETPVLHWKEHLVCPKCGGHKIDMVLTGQWR